MDSPRRADNRVFSLNLPNVNVLDIVDILIAYVLYIVTVLV